MNSKYAMIMAVVLVGASGPAIAQDKMGKMPGMNMPGMNMQNRIGMHDMAAVVTSVDSSTGVTNVDANGMKLRVHFPPSALAGVRSGDKITLHLSFTKP